jgi:hypothetical protein
MTRLQETATVIPFRRFGAPVNGIHDSDRVLLRLVEDAEQRIAPIRPTTAELKLHRKQVRHYTRLGREVVKSRGERITDLLCVSLVVWIVAIFAAAYVSGAAQ